MKRQWSFVFALGLAGLAGMFATGCKGVVLAEAHYDDPSELPETDTGQLQFEGYTASPRTGVAMQVRSPATGGRWRRVGSTRSAAAPTYLGDAALGYHWSIGYDLSALSRHKPSDSRYVQVRLFDVDDGEALLIFQRDAEQCFWSGRRAGKTPMESVSECWDDVEGDQAIQIAVEEAVEPPVCRDPRNCPRF